MKKVEATPAVAAGWIIRLARLQPWYVLIRHPNRLVKSVFVFINGSLAIGIMSVITVFTAQPMVFPSLGPTAFLFFYKPSIKVSSPRCAVLSHGAGIIIGYLSCFLCTMLFGPDNPAAQIGAAALSMGLIGAVMIAADIAHPPAASTALIVSMGFMTHWTELVAIEVAVVILAAQAYLFNRFSGVYYPLWRNRSNNPNQEFAVSPLRIQCEPNRPSAQGNYAEIADRLVGRGQVFPSKTGQ